MLEMLKAKISPRRRQRITQSVGHSMYSVRRRRGAEPSAYQFSPAISKRDRRRTHEFLRVCCCA